MTTKPKAKKPTTDELRLVISQDFQSKYERCKKTSCVEKEQFYQLQFYQDNHCMVATLEDSKWEVYCRTILWWHVYFREYAAEGYQRAFTTWLKRAGMVKGKEEYFTYPIIKVELIPFLDGMKFFNINMTSICNQNTEDYILMRSWCSGKDLSLAEAIHYKCPECDEDTSIRMICDKWSNPHCMHCEYWKADSEEYKNVVDWFKTVNWKDGFKDIPYVKIRSWIDNHLYRPVILGEYRKLIFDKDNRKGLYK